MELVEKYQEKLQEITLEIGEYMPVRSSLFVDMENVMRCSAKVPRSLLEPWMMISSSILYSSSDLF